MLPVAKSFTPAFDPEGWGFFVFGLIHRLMHRVIHMRNLLVLLLSFCPYCLMGQSIGASATPADTSEAPTYVADEVVVSATRDPVLTSQSPAPVHSIGRSAIESSVGNSLGSLLRPIPGLVVRSYGGGASLQTLSSRGMPAEHTLVLVDGQRYNNFQNGLVDLALLSTGEIERIEVARGGYSSLYGPDAVSSTVSIHTRRPPPRFGGGAAVSVGSFGATLSRISLGGTGSTLGWVASVEQERGDGDYKYNFEDGRSAIALRRQGADFRLTRGNGRLEYQVTEDLNLWATLAYTNADRGSPAAVTDPDVLSGARLKDEVARVMAGSEARLSAQTRLKLAISHIYSHQTYRDPHLLLGGSFLSSHYTNRMYAISPEIRFAFSNNASVSGGIELVHATLRSNEVADPNRTQRSAFLSGQVQIPLSVDVPHEVLIFPSIRYDGFSDVSGDVSPGVGINIGVLRSPVVRLRGTISRNFRVPAFNDLYWNTGGNRALKPERSLSYAAGAFVRVDAIGEMSLDVNLFHSEVKERIVWMPAAGIIWSPRNIARVKSRGIEFTWQWHPVAGLLRLSVSSAWNEATKRSEDFPGDPTRGKQLIYVPQQTASASATLTLTPFVVYLEHLWTSYRWTTEINNRFLPSHAVTSASVRYLFDAFGVKCFLKGEAGNIFDTSYQIIALYPMPLRELRIGAGVEL
jgi:vitamin B12 transporter